MWVVYIVWHVNALRSLFFKASWYENTLSLLCLLEMWLHLHVNPVAVSGRSRWALGAGRQVCTNNVLPAVTHNTVHIKARFWTSSQCHTVLWSRFLRRGLFHRMLCFSRTVDKLSSMHCHVKLHLKRIYSIYTIYIYIINTLLYIGGFVYIT